MCFVRRCESMRSGPRATQRSASCRSVVLLDSFHLLSFCAGLAWLGMVCQPPPQKKKKKKKKITQYQEVPNPNLPQNRSPLGQFRHFPPTRRPIPETNSVRVARLRGLAVEQARLREEAAEAYEPGSPSLLLGLAGFARVKGTRHP